METPTPVQIFTDHNYLRYFMTSKELNRRQVCWAQFLADYNFNLIHWPGVQNVVPDALSRRAQDELGMGDRAQQNQCLLPPERFINVIEELSDIHKDVFIKKISTNNSSYHVHDKLIDDFYDAYETDTFYKEVALWYYMDPAESPPFPTGSGRLCSQCTPCPGPSD